MVINRNATARKGADIVAESSARRPKTAHQTSDSKAITPREDADSVASQRGVIEGSFARITDEDTLEESMNFVERNIMNNPSLAMLSQANVDHSAIASLLN